MDSTHSLSEDPDRESVPSFKQTNLSQTGNLPSLPSPITFYQDHLLTEEREEFSSFLSTGTSKEEQTIPPKKKEKEPSACFYMPQSLLSSAEPAMPLASIAPSVDMFFEKVEETLIIAQGAQSTETRILLESPKWESSPFYGSEIIVEEFSSAPKIFNVKIIASPEAAKIIELNTPSFMQLFEERKFPFRLNRIDTGLHPYRSELRRKVDLKDGDLMDEQSEERQQ